MNKKKMNTPLLIGCGILKKEIQYLAKKKKWDIDTFFLDSSLHVDFDKLHLALEKSLQRFKEKQPMVVFYGTCHPQIDNLIYNMQAIRTMGQNCVEMLLGKELFFKELSGGAFFLMEDWVLRWNYITAKAMGDDKEAVKSIFLSEHKYFLGLRTPCSGDFSKEAGEISHSIGLPLKWKDVQLDHLEKVVLDAVQSGVNQKQAKPDK